MREGKRKAAVNDADDVAWRPTPNETAAYVLDLLTELAVLAENSRLPRLAHLINIAAEEARDHTDAGPP